MELKKQYYSVKNMHTIGCIVYDSIVAVREGWVKIEC